MSSSNVNKVRVYGSQEEISHSEFFPSFFSIIPLGSNVTCDLLFWLRRDGSLGHFHLASLQTLWSSDPTDPAMTVGVNQLSYICLAVIFLETGEMTLQTLEARPWLHVTTCLQGNDVSFLSKWMWASQERGRGDCWPVCGRMHMSVL